jgi:hypothetical protein
MTGHRIKCKGIREIGKNRSFGVESFPPKKESGAGSLACLIEPESQLRRITALPRKLHRVKKQPALFAPFVIKAVEGCELVMLKPLP